MWFNLLALKITWINFLIVKIYIVFSENLLSQTINMKNKRSIINIQ